MSTELKTRIIVRNDTTANWTAVENTAVLRKGEIGVEYASDATKIKVGDGVTVWKNLAYVTASGAVLGAIQTWGDISGKTEGDHAGTTTEMGLVKPAYGDVVDVAILNANADIIDNKVIELETNHAALVARLEALIGGETDDMEILDARAAYDGTLFNTIGEHIRSIGEDLKNTKENIGDFLDGEVVDGLKYENSQLWLTAGGVTVGDPVTITGGSGGGGGSGSGMYNVSFENLLDSRIIAVAQGESVVLEVRYVSADSEGINDGAGIGTVIVNEVRKATLAIPQGKNELDITKYLSTGTNTVKITVENSEGTSKTLVYTVTVIALAITTTAAEMDLYTGAVKFPYVLTGQGSKTVHFVMDGYELGTEIVTATDSSRTFDIPAQYDGAHIFEIYAETENEGQIISSNRLRVGMMYYSTTMTDQAVLIMLPEGTSIQQGENLTIPYMCYDPFTQNMEVTLSILREDGSAYSTKTINIDQTPKTWVTQDYPLGKAHFQITCGNATAETVVTVTESDFEREVIKDSLVLEFTANGRSNDEPNPATWNYGDITANFEGFGWASADGWIEDADGRTVLRFLPDNFMTIDYKPFATDFRTSGYTIETEFATHNVRDYDSVVVTSYNNGRGFLIKSQQAQLQSEQSTVSVQFKEDSKVRITFVVEQRSLNRFVYVYINGVMCGVTQYAESDNFGQANPVNITIGAESCGLDLHVLRIYSRGFTRHEQLNNFICDRPTLAERKELHERNNVLNDNSQIDIAHLPMNLPYMILECEELPQFKGDKKKNKSITFVDPMNPERNFTAQGVQLDVQGTSSAGYPVKNWKVSMKSGLTYTNSGEYADGFPVFEGGLEGKVWCLKADFASSEQANNVMLVDYYEENCAFKTPAQEVDDRVRQGVRGFPGCVFWQNTTTGEVTFLGKYNFNDDKSNENVFGFDRDIYPNCECWEFCNNTSDRLLFNKSEYEEWTVDEDGNPIEAWRLDFEPRFPDLDDPYKDYTQLKRMTDWVVSTNRTLATNEALAAPITYKHWSTGVETNFTNDTADYRLSKFKAEFEDYFELYPMIFYYLFTEIFLLMDNRAKNLFLTTFDGQHWFPIPYDMDSALGINNEGQLTFEYDLEDTDTPNGDNVFTGQNSALWHNVRDCFAQERRTMYQDLRSAKTLSYETINTKMANHQEAWPQAIWNEDSYNKYLNSFLLKGENYLDMLQGDKKAQRDWWLFNGFKYRDSKYNAGDALTNYITLRCYEIGNITVTPYSHLCPYIKFGSVYAGGQRVKRNESVELVCTADEMYDTEVYIYSSDRLKSVGDLSHLKVGLAIFSMATKLQEIILGSDAEGYENPNLTSLDIGNNELLTLINIQNCTSEKLTNIDASGCHSLETILAKGTKLSGIGLPDGGHLKHLELPATLANFTILNQKNIEEVTFEGYDNLTTLRVENTPGLNIEEIVNSSSKLDRIRMVNVEWNATNEASLRTTFEKLKVCVGMDAIGNNTAKAIVTGRVYIDSVSESFLEEMNDVFPELIVVVNGVAKFFVRYLNYNNTLLYRYIANEGENAINPITAGYINQPVRPDTETAKYTYVGWSEMPTNIQKPYNIVAKFYGTYRVDFCNLAGAIQESQWVSEGNAATDPVVEGTILKPTKPSTAKFNYEYVGWDRDFTNVTTPLVLLPTFEEILRSYKVYFYNDGRLLQESLIFYGETATFIGDTTEIHKYIGEEISQYYEFTGWSPSPDTPITGITYYYAQFAFDGYIEDDWTTIAAAAASGDISNYGLGGRKTMTIKVGDITSEIELEIVGKNHDKLATVDASYNNGAETAALTFICKVMPTNARIMNQTQHTAGGGTSLNSGGWAVADLRAWMQETLWAALPTELQLTIKPVIKISDLGFYVPSVKETTDKLWLASARELNAEVNSSVVTPGQGEPYPVYTDAASRMKQNSGNGLDAYWTRSTGREGQHFYRYIDGRGQPNNAGASAMNLGIPFGFCL